MDYDFILTLYNQEYSFACLKGREIVLLDDNFRVKKVIYIDLENTHTKIFQYYDKVVMYGGQTINVNFESNIEINIYTNETNLTYTKEYNLPLDFLRKIYSTPKLHIETIQINYNNFVYFVENEVYKYNNFTKENILLYTSNENINNIIIHNHVIHDYSNYKLNKLVSL